MPPGGGASRHQARSGVGPVPRLARAASRHHLPGLPHGPRARRRRRLRQGAVGCDQRQARQPERKHTNHTFYGPGYSIAHPGIFPHNPKAAELEDRGLAACSTSAADGVRPSSKTRSRTATIKVDVPRSAGPTASTATMPARSSTTISALLEEKRKLRREVMENGSQARRTVLPVGKPRRRPASSRFQYRIRNTNPGHNLPSGSLGAQPEIWLNVALIDPDGKRLWESGYVDTHGDMADLHSLDVRAGKIPHDDQLFNLQTKFLTQRQGHRPRDVSAGQFRHRSVAVHPAGGGADIGAEPPAVHPHGAAQHPAARRAEASYKVPGGLITKPGKYKLAVRLRSRAEPMYFMKFVEGDARDGTVDERMDDRYPSVHRLVRRQVAGCGGRYHATASRSR